VAAVVMDSLLVSFEDVQVVSGSERDNISTRMPKARKPWRDSCKTSIALSLPIYMKNLLIEVEEIRANFVFLLLPRDNLPRSEN